MVWHEKELPPGYREVFAVDAGNKRVGLLLNLLAAAIDLPILAVSLVLIRPWESGAPRPRQLLILLAALVVYIVLHELVHGAAYKIMTREKLSFGLTLSVAYCGVPNIYCYRLTSLISLLAPFTLFLPVFLLPAILLPDAWDRFVWAVMLAMHVGGCAGDLYNTFLFLFRFRDPRTLTRDFGSKQVFYLPEGGEPDAH